MNAKMVNIYLSYWVFSCLHLAKLIMYDQLHVICMYGTTCPLLTVILSLVIWSQKVQTNLLLRILNVSGLCLFCL